MSDMIAQLTRSERQLALVMLVITAVFGLVVAIVGRNDPLGIHGALVALLAIVATFRVITDYYQPEPNEDRSRHYYDDPTKVGIVLAMAWAVFGMFVGDWVTYLVLYLQTLARRKEPHIYVANWYYLAFILVVAMLHIVNNLAIPVSLGHSKSYSAFSGVQDAMTQWWYGHNAVAFFLTAGFLGMMYYFLPVRAGRPIFSYRLSIISFWGITFMYMWAGSHHLHYTALPHWVQTLGMTFSVMLLVPSWASAGNALLTLNGAWYKVRDDATLRFMMAAAAFYGLVTFEGSFMAIRTVNSLSHYTDWTVGHVHVGALGWVAMITFGAIYAAG